MNTRLIVAGMALCTACFAQEQQQRSRPKEEMEIPLPISSPRLVQPGTIEPLTPGQKLNRAVRNVAGARAIANRALLSGWDHWMDSPEEWSGNMDGYWQRFGDRMARLAVRQGIQLSVDVALRLDPRYDRCDCTGFKSRTGHAWRRLLLARRDNGGEFINASAFAGAFVPPFITDTWAPPSRNTANHKWTSGVSFFATRGATNMLREFWPDIARKFRLGRFHKED